MKYQLLALLLLLTLAHSFQIFGRGKAPKATNCTDTNCSLCDDVDQSICTQCKPTFYLNGTCQLCANAVASCDNCTFVAGAVQCDQCLETYILRNNTCKVCQEWIENCEGNSCDTTDPTTVTCTRCLDAYYLNNTNLQCASCELQVTNCDRCTPPEPVRCDRCRNPFILYQNLCQTCSGVITNCATCDSSVTPVICEACETNYVLFNN